MALLFAYQAMNVGLDAAAQLDDASSLAMQTAAVS